MCQFFHSHTTNRASCTGLRVNQRSFSSLTTDKRKSNYMLNNQFFYLEWDWLPKPFCCQGVLSSFLFQHALPFLPPYFCILFFPQALFSRYLQKHPPLLSEVATKPFCSLVTSANFNICVLDGSSERGEKDASKITTYPPGAVRFDCELRAVQVSCGFHHSGRFISLMFF